MAHRLPLALLALLAGLMTLGDLRAQGLKVGGPQSRISVSFSKEWRSRPQSGSVYLFVSPDLVGEPRLKMGHWSGAPWVFRQDVTRLKPDEPVQFTATTPGFPDRLSALPPGRYAIQAVFDQNIDNTDFVHANGNGRSRLKRMHLDPKSGEAVAIVIERGLTRLAPVDLPRIRYRRIESRIVGRHYGRRIFCNVALMLPPNYGARERAGTTFPVQYWIPDHGERARGALKFFQARGLYHSAETDTEIAPFIRVILDPNSPDGHHYWKDSATNGAWRTALMQEILPAIEEEFAIKAESSSRFLVGHGAGGWAATNIILRHPDHFAAASILAPDPLDVDTAFGLDLAVPGNQNAFRRADGSDRPFVLRDGRVALTLEQQARYESIVPRGGVLRSFESAMAARRDQRLFDRATGRLDPAGCRAAVTSDLKRLAIREADRLFPKLQKKLRIAVGERDDFQLAAPTLSFATAMRDRGLRLRLDTVKGADHRALDSPEIHKLVQHDLSRIWRER